MPIKNFGEKGAWAYPETAQRFKVPTIISGTSTFYELGSCPHTAIIPGAAGWGLGEGYLMLVINNNTTNIQTVPRMFSLKL